MSTLLKKLYAEPPLLQTQTIEDYYSNFAKALRQLQEEPEGEMTVGTPFFYVTDFQFSNGTAPLIWVGALNTSWKQYYKEMRRDGGFAGGTAIKSTEIGKESIPYKFIVEEGKGAKKGYLQAVRKEVKKQISKNIEFVLQTDDNEDEALTEDISKVESSKSSLFERIRQAAVKYKNINVAEAPLLKMELRLQLTDLLKQWEELKGSEKTSEQKKFITEFSGYFRMGDTLYRDRAFELLGLQKKAEMAFKGCSASKAEALKTYNDALSQNNNNAREQLRADYKELYLEWLDLDSDLSDILKKHNEYFEQTQYLSIPTEGLQIQESVERNCQKLQKVVKTELERTKINFLNLGGNEGDLVPPTPQAPTGNLVLSPLSDNQHPKLKEVLGDYNELLGDFQKGGGSNGEQLQQQMLKINEWAFIQQQEWIPQISGLRSDIALLKDELYDLEHTSTTDKTEGKLNKQITALKEKLQKLIEQLNELLGKQTELSKLQEQMYYARKELALTGKIDREYAAVLDAYERFKLHSNAYIEKKKAPQPLLGAARMMVPFIEAAQDAIDFLEARIQTWQEANTDLKRLETKNKNKNVEKIRAEIRAFAIEHKVFIFKYNEGEYEPQPYVPEEDELYLNNVQPLINNHKKERDALIEEIIRKSDKHKDSDEKKYFERRSELCNPRIKILREALENIGDWRISVRAFEVNTRLQSRLDRAESTEEAIHKELTVLQSLIEIDLITKNANKAVEKRIGLMEERTELERSKNKLAQVKTETLQDKKLEQYQKNLSDVTHKLYRNQAIQYRLSLSAVEGMKGCQLYIDRIKENLDGNDDLLDSLTAWNKKQSQGAGTVGKDFIEHIVHGFKKEYHEVLTLIKDDKEKLDALQHLQHRIAPFYVGLSRSTFETDSNAPQQLQILLLNIQGTVDDLNGKAGGVSLLGEAIEQKYNTIKSNAPGTVLVEGLQLLLQSIDEWEKQHAHRETDRTEYWWGKLELIRKEILQRLQRDDVEAYRRILDVQRAIKQCRQYIDDATETLTELGEPLDDKAKAIQTKIAQLKTTLDQFDQRANQVRTLPDANLLLSEILADALTPLRDNLKELMLLQMESPNVINKEKETFAALGDGFDMYHHRGMVIPNDEQKKINELGTRMTDRVHKLMKLGISPEELMPRLSHIPFTLLPNDLIPEMQAFKQVRQALLENKMKEVEKEELEALSSDEWAGKARELIDQAQNPEQLNKALEALANQPNSPLSEEVLEAIKDELKLDKNKDVEEWNKDLKTVQTVLKVIRYVNKALSIAAKKGEKLGTVDAPIQPDNEGLSEENALPTTSGAQMAGVCKGITSIFGGVAKIIKQFKADETRNPQQELNDLMHRYFGVCEGIFSIGLGATKIAAVFQEGLDSICGAFSIARGVMKMADAIVSLVEHKSLQNKTKGLQERAIKDDSPLMYAFKQELDNIGMQIKGDAVKITSGALLTGSGVSSVVGGPIGLAVSGWLKTASIVVEKAWEGYQAKATKKNIEKVTKLFSQVVIGNRDAVTELFAKSAYYAKMLIVVYATAGDQLALQYCLHRGIAPADLDNELYSKKVLFDYLLECSEEKMGEIEKAILGNPDPKAQAQKEDSLKMPELEKDLAEKIKSLPKELKSLLVSTGKKVQGLFKTIEKTITKVVEKVNKKLPKLQLVLGSTINKDFLELEKDDVVQLEEIIGLFEEYNKIITQTASESAFKAFFSKFEPLNALKALKQSLMDYRKSAEELLEKLQRELFEASQKSPDEVLTLGSTHTSVMELLQKRLLQLRIITELYELFEI